MVSGVYGHGDASWDPNTMGIDLEVRVILRKLHGVSLNIL